MKGPGNIDSASEDNDYDQIILTIAQLISYHTIKRSRGEKIRRHDRNRETPVAVYVALKIYGDTRNKDLIDVMHKLGLYIIRQG